MTLTESGNEWLGIGHQRQERWGSGQQALFFPSYFFKLERKASTSTFASPLYVRGLYKLGDQGTNFYFGGMGDNANIRIITVWQSVWQEINSSGQQRGLNAQNGDP